MIDDMSSGIIAGIVTYNPAVEDVRRNVTGLVEQVTQVVIVDNASSNIEQIRAMAYSIPKCVLLENKDNLGIACALNQIFQFAREAEAEWVLTLDDDSIIPEDMVERYRAHLSMGVKQIGILCPLLEDKTSHTLQHSKKNTKECITSGSLTSVQAWDVVGGFDSWLFIDGVDFDFSRRLIDAGYSIDEVPEVVMLHEIGNTTIRRLFGRDIEVMSHAPIRKYYQERNYPYIDYKLGSHTYLKELLRFCKHVALLLFFENDKWCKLKAMVGGRTAAYRRIREYKRERRSI
jgi:rhamnosyltransferase